MIRSLKLSSLAAPSRRPSRRPHRCATTRQLPTIAILGGLLALAGCSAGGSDASQVAAVVNGDEITVHQIDHVLRSSRGVSEANVEGVRKEILNRLVQQQVLVQAALKEKLDRDPQIMQNLEAARRDVLARSYLERRARAVSLPGDSTLRDFYDGHPELFRDRKIFRVNEFTLERVPQERLASLMPALEKATSLRDAVSAVTAAGGEVAIVSNVVRPSERLGVEVRSDAARARVGELIQFEAQGGAWTVAEVRAVSEAPLTLEQARPIIEQILNTRARREQLEAESRTALETATVEFRGQYAALADAAAGRATATDFPRFDKGEAPAAAPAVDVTSGELGATASGTAGVDGEDDAAARARGLRGLR